MAACACNPIFGVCRQVGLESLLKQCVSRSARDLFKAIKQSNKRKASDVLHVFYMHVLRHICLHTIPHLHMHAPNTTHTFLTWITQIHTLSNSCGRSYLPVLFLPLQVQLWFLMVFLASVSSSASLSPSQIHMTAITLRL